VNFDGALVTEQGVTFGVLAVKPHVLRDTERAAEMRKLGTRAWGRVPIVLMAQDVTRRPTYQGRHDLVQFLARIDMRRVPFRRWNLPAA
jgi:hypothetical protein